MKINPKEMETKNTSKELYEILLNKLTESSVKLYNHLADLQSSEG